MEKVHSVRQEDICVFEHDHEDTDHVFTAEAHWEDVLRGIVSLVSAKPFEPWPEPMDSLPYVLQVE